ncbi:MAG: hypothetical protein IPK58_05215 [Acidobacteria bacterium]|nr:hypothetical protein [Acidobacteriota bacterium]
MDELHQLLTRCLEAHREWIIVTADGRSFSLQNSEVEIEVERGRTLIGFPGDGGFRTWRVTAIETRQAELHLSLSRDFGRETTRVRIVPRASFGELQATVEIARLERANRVAALLRENVPRAKLVRVELNRENGRFAQIIFDRFATRQAAISDVSGTLTPEFLLSAACFWLAKLERRKRNPVRSIVILAEKRVARQLQKLHALLSDDWKRRVALVEIGDEEPFKELDPLDTNELWTGKVPEVRVPAVTVPSETSRRLIELAPAEIDSVFARQGETIRYQGLAFARVRRLMGVERCWFGLEKVRRPLTETNIAELATLIEEFREFRSHKSPNRRHLLYQTAPESWLEAILRRNIHLLDANLILSPLYHQFRAERDKIDLLALRKDGRLVIIELKVEPDREMIFQTVDYWRKIERIRRSGKLRDARLFGDLEIADAPTICYLVAPTLAFHRDFDFSASLVSREIEIHRFNLAEDWRRKLRVLERRRVTGNPVFPDS